MLLVVTSFYLSNFLHAQEEGNRIGFGVSLGKEIIDLDGGALTLFDFPSFYLPISISSRFRLEPEIGYYHYSGSDEDWKVSETIISGGCGIFFMTRKEKVNIYFGARLGIMSTSSSWEYSWNGQEKDKDSKTDFFIGPALGGEYFFTKNLSLGGEIQVNYINLGQWSDSDGSESVIRTKSLIFIRWYL